jgi:chloramphenicol-sensitive protein RarD
MIGFCMENKSLTSGLLAISANFILGVSSIYWAIFNNIDPVEIVAFRIIFSLIVLLFILFWLKKVNYFFQSINLYSIYLHSIASILVAINWGTFIWASLNKAVLESGFGYLVAPVFTIIVGSLLFKEKLSSKKVLAVIVIVITIGVLILSSGSLNHWIYLTIAVTWGGYTIVKKITTLNSIEGLLLETFVLSFLILLGITINFGSFLDVSISTLDDNPLLTTTGIITVIPLIMFSFAANKLSSYEMGLFQFVLPTSQLIVSYVYFDQIASPITYVCFTLIWLLLFFVSMRTPTLNLSMSRLGKKDR